MRNHAAQLAIIKQLSRQELRVLSLCRAGAPLLFPSHFPAFTGVEIGSSVIMHNMSNEGTEFFQARSADSGCGPRVEYV